MRAARPVYGALFKVCERAIAAGKLDRDAGAQVLRRQFQAGAHPAGSSHLRLLHRRRRLLHRLLRGRSHGLARQDRGLQRPALSRAGRTCGQEEHGVRAIRSHRNRGRGARRQGTGDLLDQKSGRCFLRADPGLDARQARRRRIAAAQLHRQQRQALHAGRPHPDRPGPLHARRNVDGQDPRIHGSQSGRGQGAAREEPLLRVLLRDAARAQRGACSARKASR